MGSQKYEDLTKTTVVRPKIEINKRNFAKHLCYAPRKYHANFQLKTRIFEARNSHPSPVLRICWLAQMVAGEIPLYKEERSLFRSDGEAFEYSNVIAKCER